MSNTPLADEWIAAVNAATGCTFTVGKQLTDAEVVRIRCKCDPPFVVRLDPNDLGLDMSIDWITEEHAKGPPPKTP